MDQRIKPWVDFQNKVSDDNCVEAQLLIDKNLPSFAGHFPGSPILPAVTMIDISLLLLSQVHKDLAFHKVAIEKSKFMAMVKPGDSIQLKAEKTQGKTWVVQWFKVSDQSQVAKIQIVV